MLFMTKAPHLSVPSDEELRIIGKNWHPWRYLLIPAIIVCVLIGLALVIALPAEILANAHKHKTKRPTSLLLLCVAVGGVLLLGSAYMCNKGYAVWEYVTHTNKVRRHQERIVRYQAAKAPQLSSQLTADGLHSTRTSRSQTVPNPDLLRPPTRDNVTRQRDINLQLDTEDKDDAAERKPSVSTLSTTCSTIVIDSNAFTDLVDDSEREAKANNNS